MMMPGAGGAGVTIRQKPDEDEDGDGRFNCMSLSGRVPPLREVGSGQAVGFYYFEIKMLVEYPVAPTWPAATPTPTLLMSFVCLLRTQTAGSHCVPLPGYAFALCLRFLGSPGDKCARTRF